MVWQAICVHAFSLYPWLPGPGLWPYDAAEHRGREYVMEQGYSFPVWDPNIPFKSTSPLIEFPPTRVLLLKYLPPLKSIPCYGSNLQHTCFGDPVTIPITTMCHCIIYLIFASSTTNLMRKVYQDTIVLDTNFPASSLHLHGLNVWLAANTIPLCSMKWQACFLYSK